MKIYKFIASLYIGAAIITLIVALCITSCDAQIFPLKKEKVDISFYTTADIFTVQGTLDSVVVWSEICPEPVFTGSYLEATIIIAQVSHLAVGVENYLYEENYPVEGYWDTHLGIYSIYGCPEIDPEWYSTWVARYYDSEIEDILLSNRGLTPVDYE